MPHSIVNRRPGPCGGGLSAQSGSDDTVSHTGNPVGSYQLWMDCIGKAMCAFVQTSRTPGIRTRLLQGYRHRYRQPPSNAILAKLEEAMILTAVAAPIIRKLLVLSKCLQRGTNQRNPSGTAARPQRKSECTVAIYLTVIAW